MFGHQMQIIKVLKVSPVSSVDVIFVQVFNIHKTHVYVTFFSSNFVDKNKCIMIQFKLTKLSFLQG